MSFEWLIYFFSFIAPSLGALIVFLFGKKRFIKETISTLSISLAIFSTILCWNALNISDKKALLLAQIFYIDGFSIIMQLMVEFVALMVILYSSSYIPKVYSHRKENFHIYYSVILLSTGFMNLTFSLNNLFWLYITLELSSILSVYLIVFNLNKESLKAGFKYLILINVGILFSLLGIILLFHMAGNPVMITNIGEVIKSLPRNIALLSAFLFIIGFFTKAGLIPFHLWLPDSYAESPSAVTVFLTGAVTKLGFYGLVRTVTIFSFNYEEIKVLVITLSSLSMLFGAILAFNQKDIKKLIAYVSISEMGFIASALVLKTYEGIFGGVFHLINHTLMKGALFFATGAIIYTCGSRKLEEIKTLIIKMPAIKISFFIGTLAVGGMPLFASFLSSITIFFALTNEGFLLASIVLIVSEFLSVVILLKTAISIFWQKNDKSKVSNSSVPFLMIFCTGLFVVLLIIFGIYPEIIYPIIDSATIGIIKIID
ncbi:complex I subunit 5 family protein [Thermodesulfovibrio yellowstonii]|uniref:Na+/H+ antiporter subunit n=1 Tax=Thermodesulfovibrio yellowstonii TaxID=28262 RepID=A0A9W6GGN8_9BACT|nr:proton-conducting transporter membrane subunit [Thermodesulfovibrio islandicus]GLI53546.1 Na+/H+ antiporter subunit [Thermodesulfovibrio islandicus]